MIRIRTISQGDYAFIPAVLGPDLGTKGRAHPERGLPRASPAPSASRHEGSPEFGPSQMAKSKCEGMHRHIYSQGQGQREREEKIEKEIGR